MTGEYDGDGENTVVILPDKEFVEDARVMIVRTKRVTGGCNGSRDFGDDEQDTTIYKQRQ